MIRAGKRFGNSSTAILVVSLALMALITAGYFSRGIPFGFTITILLVLAAAIYSAKKSLKPEQQKLQGAMKLIVSLSLAIAAVLTTVHLLHK